MLLPLQKSKHFSRGLWWELAIAGIGGEWDATFGKGRWRITSPVSSTWLEVDLGLPILRGRFVVFGADGRQESLCRSAVGMLCHSPSYSFPDSRLACFQLVLKSFPEHVPPLLARRAELESFPEQVALRLRLGTSPCLFLGSSSSKATWADPP